MNRLTTISKKIIQSKLYDKGIIITMEELDNYIIDPEQFDDLNSMYNSIVNNFNQLTIAL